MSDKEEGEISDCSIENNNTSFKDLTINCDSNDLTKYSSSNYSSSNCSNYSLSKNVSLKDSERCLMDLFTMDLDYDQQLVNNDSKPNKKAFTMWSEQLIAEKNRELNDLKDEELYNKKFGNQRNHVKNRLRTKKEQKSLVDFSADIAYSLKENRKDIVLKIVKAIGTGKSAKLCKEAQKIYSTVGMLTPEGRKRTLGGCFFQLVKLKGNLDDATRKDIFNEPPTKKEKQLKNAKKRMKRLKSQQEQQQNDNQNNLLNILKEQDNHRNNLLDILKGMNINVCNQSNLMSEFKKQDHQMNSFKNQEDIENNLVDILKNMNINVKFN